MKVRFGVCADLHTEYIHDSVARMDCFLHACEEAACDFGIELGDFCPPGEKNISHNEKWCLPDSFVLASTMITCYV